MRCAFGAHVDVGLAERQTPCRFIETVRRFLPSFQGRWPSLIRRNRYFWEREKECVCVTAWLCVYMYMYIYVWASSPFFTFCSPFLSFFGTSFFLRKIRWHQNRAKNGRVHVWFICLTLNTTALFLFLFLFSNLWGQNELSKSTMTTDSGLILRTRDSLKFFVSLFLCFFLSLDPIGPTRLPLLRGYNAQTWSKAKWDCQGGLSFFLSCVANTQPYNHWNTGGEHPQ